MMMRILMTGVSKQEIYGHGGRPNFASIMQILGIHIQNRRDTFMLGETDS